MPLVRTHTPRPCPASRLRPQAANYSRQLVSGSDGERGDEGRMVAISPLVPESWRLTGGRLIGGRLTEGSWTRGRLTGVLWGFLVFCFFVEHYDVRAGSTVMVRYKVSDHHFIPI